MISELFLKAVMIIREWKCVIKLQMKSNFMDILLPDTPSLIKLEYCSYNFKFHGSVSYYLLNINM